MNVVASVNDDTSGTRELQNLPFSHHQPTWDRYVLVSGRAQRQPCLPKFYSPIGATGNKPCGVQVPRQSCHAQVVPRKICGQTRHSGILTTPSLEATAILSGPRAAAPWPKGTDAMPRTAPPAPPSAKGTWAPPPTAAALSALSGAAAAATSKAASPA
jgi:hypothetical protein